MTNATAFKPLSKNDVADVLGICPRTIDNWVGDGTLLPPTKLGNRVYWHPKEFYAWLDRRLSGDGQPTAATPDDKPEPRDVQPTATTPDDKPEPQPAPVKPKGRGRPATTKTELDKVRNRTQAQLDALMAGRRPGKGAGPRPDQC